MRLIPDTLDDLPLSNVTVKFSVSVERVQILTSVRDLLALACCKAFLWSNWPQLCIFCFSYLGVLMFLRKLTFHGQLGTVLEIYSQYHVTGGLGHVTRVIDNANWQSRGGGDGGRGNRDTVWHQQRFWLLMVISRGEGGDRKPEYPKKIPDGWSWGQVSQRVCREYQVEAL